MILLFEFKDLLHPIEIGLADERALDDLHADDLLRLPQDQRPSPLTTVALGSCRLGRRVGAAAVHPHSGVDGVSQHDSEGGRGDAESLSYVPVA